MREIKFRGKNKNMGWVYGYYCGYGQMKLEGGGIAVVDPKTVGQYTGLKDKKGVEIYEGDFVRSELGKVQVIKYVHQYIAKDSYFMGFIAESPGGSAYGIATTDEIIGNIHNISDKEEPTCK